MSFGVVRRQLPEHISRYQKDFPIKDPQSLIYASFIALKALASCLENWGLIEKL